MSGRNIERVWIHKSYLAGSSDQLVAWTDQCPEGQRPEAWFKELVAFVPEAESSRLRETLASADARAVRWEDKVQQYSREVKEAQAKQKEQERITLSYVKHLHAAEKERDAANDACSRVVKDRDYIEGIADRQIREFIGWLKEEKDRADAAEAKVKIALAALESLSLANHEGEGFCYEPHGYRKCSCHVSEAKKALAKLKPQEAKSSDGV